MKNILAIGLACCIPLGLAAEDPSEAYLGTVNVLVIEDAAPGHQMCAGPAERSECMAFSRAVLTARVQKVSALHERGRWI
ncbi:MAG TPA: hypothetical protein VF309_00190 [Usitatibacter sp.]